MLAAKLGFSDNVWSFRGFLEWFGGVLDRSGVVWNILERRCEVEIG